MTLYALFGIAIMVVGGFISNFNIIGASNRYRDEKKEKKINIEKSKLRKLIPYHGQHFHLPWVKIVSPYFDGTVFVKTYLLAIVNLIASLINILFFITFFIFYIIGYSGIVGKYLMYTFVCFEGIVGTIFVIILTIQERKFVKREKEEGMNFKI